MSIEQARRLRFLNRRSRIRLRRLATTPVQRRDMPLSRIGDFDETDALPVASTG
jgi:hypothetical protein